jgi:hypothetical protein
MNSTRSQSKGLEVYNLCTLCLNTQSLAEIEHSVFRLAKPVGECCKGKRWLFIVRNLWNTRIYLAEKFIVLNLAVNVGITICKELIVFVTQQNCQNSGKNKLLETDTKLVKNATRKSGNPHKQSRLPQKTFHLHHLRKHNLAHYEVTFSVRVHAAKFNVLRRQFARTGWWRLNVVDCIREMFYRNLARHDSYTRWS